MLTSKEELEGHCFQAVDRHYSDGRGTVWEPHYTPSASLRKTTKCLGGVQIGSVKARKLDALVTLVRAHPTIPKFEGWNCRDWILEVVELLATEGWINKSFVALGEDPQARLLVDFRKVSQNTVARSQDEFNPDVQWIQWYVRAVPKLGLSSLSEKLDLYHCYTLPHLVWYSINRGIIWYDGDSMRDARHQNW